MTGLTNQTVLGLAALSAFVGNLAVAADGRLRADRAPAIQAAQADAADASRGKGLME